MSEASPLTEVDPEALAKLFAADPQELNDRDINVLVVHYRTKRSQFMQSEIEKRAKKSSRGGAKKAIPENLTLDMLLA